MRKVQKSLIALVVCVLTSMSLLTSAFAADSKNPFTDINKNNYFYNAVLWAAENQITAGRTKTTFGPAEECTRAQAVTFLWRSAGEPDPKSMTSTFSDVTQSGNKSSYKAILWAAESKIATGYTNGTFQPFKPVTRGEFLTFLYRYNGLPKVDEGDNPFVDLDPVRHKNLKQAVLWAYQNEITKGRDSTHFEPDVICSRCNAVEFLYRTECHQQRTGVTVLIEDNAYDSMLWADLLSAFAGDTGIYTTILLQDEEEIMNNLPKMIANGECPDVIMSSSLQSEFVEEEKLVDISSILSMKVPGENKRVKDKLLNGYIDNATAQPYGDGKVYMMPMFYMPFGLFYNVNLFEEKGWSLPTTWDEMWALGEKAEKEGLSLFTYPDDSYLDAMELAVMHQCFGTDFNKALYYDDEVWKSEKADKFLGIMNEFAAHTHSDTPESDSDVNQRRIVDKEALFMPNGYWVLNEYEEEQSAGSLKWGAIAIPALDEGESGRYFAGFERIWIPKESNHLTVAKKFIAYMYSDKAADIFSAYGEIMPIKGLTDKLDEDYDIYHVSDNNAVAVVDNFAPIEEYRSFRGTYFGAISQLVKDELTVEQWKKDIIEMNAIFRGMIRE